MLSTNSNLAWEDLTVRLYRGSRVLVTGADGFIGSHLVERLVSEGAEVTALALYNSFDSYGWLDDLPDNIRAQLTLVRGDVRDADFVRRLLEGQQIVFHLAALIAIPHSYVAAESYVDTNVRGTLHVLEAARACGTERVVHTSTSEVYGTAITVPISEEHPLQGQSLYLRLENRRRHDGGGVRAIFRLAGLHPASVQHFRPAPERARGHSDGDSAVVGPIVSNAPRRRSHDLQGLHVCCGYRGGVPCHGRCIECRVRAVL